jgi:hypothetical protein
MPDQHQLATMRRPHLLDGFTARMTVHAPHSSAERVSAVCAQEGLGAIYTTPFGQSIRHGSRWRQRSSTPMRRGWGRSGPSCSRHSATAANHACVGSSRTTRQGLSTSRASGCAGRWVEILAQSSPSNPWLTVAVALIAAVTALIGAAIAAITAGRRQRRELAHDRELADVGELRAVLDEAAGNLARADRAMHKAEERRPVSDDVEKELDRSQDAMSDSAQRLRIRLGGGEAYTAYQKASMLSACSEVWFQDASRTATSRSRSAVSTKVEAQRRRSHASRTDVRLGAT